MTELLMLTSFGPAWWPFEGGVVNLQKNNFGVSRINSLEPFSCDFQMSDPVRP
jgi:hypothetical protein